MDIDTRDPIGTLEMEGIEILKDEPFTVKVFSGTEEDGNSEYADKSYQQLIQIYYKFKDLGKNKWISSPNFEVYDSSGKKCKTPADIPYDTIEKDGFESFVVMSENRTECLAVNFKYNVFQSTNKARIKLVVSEKESFSKEEPMNTDDNPDSSEYNKNNTKPPVIESFLFSQKNSVSFVVVIVLVFVIILLCIAVVSLYLKKK